MTDPSFARQLITFTYPHVGNYGVSQEAMESERPWARAAIMRAAVNREDAPGAERGWLDWLSRLRRPGDHRRRHARARAPHPHGGRDARRRLPGADERGRGARADRGRAVDGRPGPRARGDAGGDDRARRRRRPADRGHRHRDQGLDRPPPRRARRARRAAPVHGDGGRADGQRPRRGLPGQRPRRPRGAGLRRRHRARARRHAAGVGDLPRPPAAVPGGRPGDLQAAPSATAAPTTRSRTCARAGSRSPPRTTASRSARRTAAGAWRPTSRCAGRPTSARRR